MSEAGAAPTVLVAEVRRSIEFYAYLGFEVKGQLESEGDLSWAWLATDGAELMVNRAGAPFEVDPDEVVLHLYGRDLQRLAGQLGAAGVTVAWQAGGAAPALRLLDPDGHALLVTERE